MGLVCCLAKTPFMCFTKVAIAITGAGSGIGVFLCNDGISVVSRKVGGVMLGLVNAGCLRCARTQLRGVQESGMRNLGCRKRRGKLLCNAA